MAWGDGTLRAMWVQGMMTGNQHRVPCPQVCLHYLGSSSRVRQAHHGRPPLPALEVASAMEPHPVLAYRSLPP